MSYMLAAYVSAEQSLSIKLQNKLNISVKLIMLHIPAISIGQGRLDDEELLTEWLYRTEIKCGVSCGGSRKTLLREFVSKSQEMANKCLPPYNSLIQLVGERNQTNLRIYVNASGHCFKVDGTSYYSKKKIEIYSKLYEL